jgi:hypothetical protein
MKKLIAMAAVAMTMMIASCSGDDSDSTNNNPNENGPLLTKMIETYDEEIFTTYYHYDGNKLTGTTTDGGHYSEYTYTDDKLTKYEYFTEDDILIDKNLFTYNAEGKLSELLEIHFFDDESYYTKTVYTHNSNGNISVSLYSGDETEQNELLSTGTVVVQNGNIMSIALNYVDGESWVDTFTYDNKNDSFKNVFASDVLALRSIFDNGGGWTNNVLTIDTTYPEGGDYTFTYTYNSEGYPITSSDTFEGEPDGEYQFFYN